MIKSNEKTYIGIDFSMNSTGLAILQDNVWKFANFPRDIKVLKFPWNEIPIDIINNQFEKNFNTYQEGEIIKMKDSLHLTTLIIDYIIANVKDVENCVVGLEGISFSSKGSSTVDIGGYQWILRSQIYQKLGLETLVFAPQTIKKFAGNGRYKKEDMIEKWFLIENESLNDSPFWIWAKKQKDEGKKVKKPVDDIVDSYFIIKTLQQFSNV